MPVRSSSQRKPCKNPSCTYAAHSNPEKFDVQEGYCCNACYGHYTQQVRVSVKTKHFRHCEKNTLSGVEPMEPENEAGVPARREVQVVEDGRVVRSERASARSLDGRRENQAAGECRSVRRAEGGSGFLGSGRGAKSWSSRCSSCF